MNNRLKYNVYGVLIYSAWALSMDIFMRTSFKLPLELLALLDCFWIFYSGYAFLYFLFLGPPAKKLLSIPLAVISVLGSFSINLAYMAVRRHFYHPGPYTLREVFYTTVQEFSFFFIYSVGYFFLVRYLQKQRQLRTIEQQQADDYQRRLELEKSNALLQQQKLLLEKDLLQMENDFLRAQINPHFLYNCLNFFYSETFERQPRLAEAVLLLSQVMRYSLTDFSATGGFARLDGELDHLRNVIEIHRMRYENNLQIEFSCEGDTRGKLIAPMILMTLVENVMKHGDLQDPQYPALIRCRVNGEEKRIYFSTTNKKAPVKSSSRTGIGLANIQQRLQRMYEDDFTLTFTDEPFLFKEELVIPYFDDRTVPGNITKPLTHFLC